MNVETVATASTTASTTAGTTASTTAGTGEIERLRARNEELENTIRFLKRMLSERIGEIRELKRKIGAADAWEALDIPDFRRDAGDGA